MNRETVMKELALLLDDVLIHPAVAGEIKQLILGTGNEKKFIKQLTKQVGLLKEYGINVIQLPQFEKLKNYRGLYSMHLESNVYNIRMLYTYGKMAKLYCIAFMKKRARKLLAMRNMHQLQWKENGKWRFDYECKTNEIK